MLGNTLVGRYQIIRHLAGGGFGETFVACDTQLPGLPQCVVKKLKPQSNDPVSLQTARRLFDTEAQVLYKLGTHDRIPQLLAYFEENEEFYLVQEFIEGHDLSQELTSEKALSQAEVISLLQEILEILEFVHRQKVIHRDVNPRNILRRELDNKLILIDFGAVKEITTQGINPQLKTKSTVAIGTPGYMPGEQAQGSPKYSSDIYAVGIIAIQALTGLSPDQIEKDAETNEIIWQNHTPTVSSDLAQVLDKMVRYDFRQRYASATLALQVLKDLKKPQSKTITLNFSPLKNQITKVKEKQKAILINSFIGLAIIGGSIFGSIAIVNKVNSNNAIDLYNQGNTLYELQRYQDALSVYEKAVDIKPKYAQGWNGQGKTLYELKRYKEALTAYDKAIQIQPNYLDAWSGRGFVLEKLHRYTEAIASFDKALELQNNHPHVWNAKGEALSYLAQYDKAVKAYDKAIEFKADYYEAWYHKGLALQNLKRYDEAIASFGKAVELKPDYSLAWYNRGNALVKLQRYQEAFTAYDKAVQYKENYYQAWLSRGNMLINLQRYLEAIESFNQVIKYNRNIYQAWLNRGWALHKMQRYDDAITSYNKAIEIKHNDYQVWYNLGNSLFNLNKYQEAIASYNKAIRYKPDSYETWYSRGNALYNLKRYQEAITSYEQAIKFKPDYKEAIDARNVTESILQAEKSKLPLIPNF